MSDSEYEEEEILVFADFKNQLMQHELSDPKTAIKLIGIETQNPIAEINGNMFKGSYDYAMGTNVFFENDEQASAADPLFEQTCKQKYKYFAKTTKVINFQRIFVESNTEATAKGDSAEAEPDKEAAAEKDVNMDEATANLKTNLTYEEAIKVLPAVAELQWKDKDAS